MKYPYIVNKNGIWYSSGAEVPEDTKSVYNKEVEEATKENSVNTPNYSKTDINRMPVEQLRKMAMNTGVEGADTMTGKELKEYLFAIFNL